MTGRTRTFFLPFFAAAASACLVHDEPAPPLCVSGFERGDALVLRLGEPYDATSRYWFDAELIGAPWYAAQSCSEADGLREGSVVTFTLDKWLLPSSYDCTPWLAWFQPEVMLSPQLAVERFPSNPGVTIAAAFADGTLDGLETRAVRGLFTPNGDPNSEPVEQELPPLVVTRGLDQSSAGNRCLDAWIASWEQ